MGWADPAVQGGLSIVDEHRVAAACGAAED
jgi:hypothetical protein